MSLNFQKIEKLDARILAVLNAHLWEFLNPYNNVRPPESQIKFPKLYVNVDLVSLENLNAGDIYPVLSVYPSTSVTALNITDRQTVRSVWNVEAAIFSYEGNVDFSARTSVILANMAAQCLETYLPSVGDPCIYDVQLRENYGTKRMQMPRTTWRGWSSIAKVEIFQRFEYDFKPSKVNALGFNFPILENRPYYEGTIAGVPIQWKNQTSIPLATFTSPVTTVILPNVEGKISTDVIGLYVLPNGTTTTVGFSFVANQWIGTLPHSGVSVGDKIILTLIADQSWANITTITITA